jgi:cell division protein FtsZ
MRKGGVAILGSATANGENRAQRAIENALNSPLLNDNDIRGAKWILININSAEGENEFTMDEVEIIQNYLLTHAGSESDVILGLGYDSNLEDNIGITLIATGFEHRDPFEGTMVPQKKNEVEEQKIVMTLGVEGEEKKLYGQPALPFDDKDPLAPMLVDNTRQNNPDTQEPKLTQALQDQTPEVFVLSMEAKQVSGPELFKLQVEETPATTPEVFTLHMVEAPASTPEVFKLHMEEESVSSAETFALNVVEKPVENTQEEAGFFEMKVAETPMPVVHEMPMEPAFTPEVPEDLEVMSTPVVPEEISEKIEMVYLSSTPQVPVEIKPAEAEKTVSPLSNFTEEDHKDASTTTTSGGFLAKPSNIYAEEPIDLKSKQESFEDLVKFGMEEDGPIFDMQIVIKEPKAVEEPGTPTIHATLGSVEEPAMQDEAEDQKRKAAERLHKLRNLSFNINAADPNNEFESVPAYIRRNLEVHNTTLTSVEKFYSNYTVKSDENNQGQISTINTFLEGKKPD